MNLNSKTFLISLSIIFVISIFGWGVWLSGSPQYNRRVAFDNRRVEDMQSISNNIVNHYSYHKKLPTALTDINIQYGSVKLPKDPETERDYEFRAISQFDYEICTVFSENSPELAKPNASRYQSFRTIEHTAGRFCKTYSIPEWNRDK